METRASAGKRGTLPQAVQGLSATHSASSHAFAAFTGFADGDTRTGLFYADRDVMLGGFCDRQLSFGAAHIDFVQEFAIQAHKGFDEVVDARVRRAPRCAGPRGTGGWTPR